jgi:hypothetical protein
MVITSDQRDLKMNKTVYMMVLHIIYIMNTTPKYEIRLYS